MNERNDQTGFEAKNPVIEKLLRPKVELRIDREHLRSTIESAGWKIFWDTTLKLQLDDWKQTLLTRAELSEGERRGLIYARTVLLEGILKMYVRTGAHVPEWFAKELEEIGISYES